jgi:hypothetical protein
MNNISRPEYLNWLTQDSSSNLKTSCGKDIEVWTLKHLPSDEILAEWAKHFRQHYCEDADIDILREGTPHNTRGEYLTNLVFPDKYKPPGPSTRSGDFSEILIHDFLEFIISGYVVPRLRYESKAVRNESTKGTDVIGFKIIDPSKSSTDDTLITFEVKANLTGSTKNKLQEAIESSNKDIVRKAETLNSYKRTFHKNNNSEKVKLISRFQNKSDNPFTEITGAAAVLSSATFSAAMLNESNATEHNNYGNLTLIVIQGNELMTLVA